MLLILVLFRQRRAFGTGTTIGEFEISLMREQILNSTNSYTWQRLQNKIFKIIVFYEPDRYMEYIH